jgi:hypothetical protein
MAVVNPFLEEVSTGLATNPFLEPIEVDRYANPTYNNTKDSDGISISAQINANRAEIEKNSRGFWSSISDSLVGEKAEFGEYWAQGLGQSNANLISQYYFNKSIGKHWQQAFNTELEDTGIAERFVQTLGTIVGDIPTFTAGAIPGILTQNPFLIGFGGAALNEKVKEMYLEALKKGQVDTFEEWWKIFIDTGFKNAAKAGLQLGTTLAVPGFFGAKGFLANTVTQQAAFEGMGIVLNGELPNKDDLINNFLLFGSFNLGKIGQKKATKIAAEEGLDGPQTILELNIDPTKVADTVSINLKSWRKGDLPFEQPKPLTLKEIEAVNKRKGIEKDVEPIEITESFLEKDISSWEATKNTLNYYWFDKLAPIKKVVDLFYKVKKGERTFGERLKEEFGGDFDILDPYQMMRILPGEMAKANMWHTKGTHTFAEPGVKSGKALNEILNKIVTEKQYIELRDYLIGLRVLELNKRGLKTPFDRFEAENNVRRYKKQYDAIAKELREYQKKQMDYLEDSGFLDKATRKAIEEANKDYVPFRYLLEDGISNLGVIPLKTTKRIGGLKEYKGSEKGSIIDPIDSIYTNTTYYLTLAEKNVAISKFVEMVEGNPALAKELGIKNVTNKAKKIEISEKEVAKNLGLTEKQVKEIGVEKFDVFRKEGHRLSETEITVYRNGKRQVWEMPKELIEPFSGTNIITTHLQNSLSKPFVKALTLPTKALRTGVVLDPVYMVKNLFRDSWLTSIVSRHGFAIPFTRTFNGIFTRVFGGEKGKAAFDRFERSGALQSTIQSFDRYGQAGVKGEFQSRTLHNQIHSNKINSFVELLRAGSEFTEVAAKFGEFLYVEKKFNKVNLQKPGTYTNREILQKAGFEARDLFDFAKAGYGAEAVNSFSAFYTSRLRGYEKMYEAFKDRPIKTLFSGTLWLTFPTLGLWFVNYDDPLHDRLPQWKKDLFWNIPINKSTTTKLYNDYINQGLSEKDAMDAAINETDQFFLSLPIPWEMGLLFAKLPERIFDAVYKQEPKLVVDFFMDSAKNLDPRFTFDALRPFDEIANNKSVFYDRPIVPPNIENSLMPEFEYSRATSEFSKGIGQILAPLNLGSFGSPAKIDHLIKSWSGGVGKQLLDFTDFIAEKTGLVETPASPWSADWVKNLDSIPFVKAFVIRQPGQSSVHVQKLWNTFSQLKQVEQTINRLESELAISNPEKFQTELSKILSTPEGIMYNLLWGTGDAEGPVKIISKLKKDINIIYNMPDTSMFGPNIIEDIKKLYKYYGNTDETLAAFKRKYEGMFPLLFDKPDSVIKFYIEDVATGGTFVSKFLPSPNDKKEQLDRLYNAMIKIAIMGNDLVEQLKENIEK